MILTLTSDTRHTYGERYRRAIEIVPIETTIETGEQYEKDHYERWTCPICDQNQVHRYVGPTGTRLCDGCGAYYIPLIYTPDPRLPPIPPLYEIWVHETPPKDKLELLENS